MSGLPTIVTLVVAAASAEPRVNPWVEPARDALVQACGSCHRPDQPTSNPRALAVFNLHDAAWYGAMTGDQLRELRRRIAASSRMDEADKKAVLAFVDCSLDGRCSEASAKESP